MQAKEFANVLRSFAGLVDEVGATDRSCALRKFGDAIGTAEGQSVSKVVGSIQKSWKVSKRPGSFPNALRSQLEQIRVVLAASKSKAATDCSALQKLFWGDQSGNVETFVADIATAISSPATTSASRTKKAPAGLAPEAIDAIANQLIQHRLDNVRFDAALNELKTRKLKKPDLQMIASRFLGSERTFKSGAEAIKAIRSRQLQDALQASRERRIEKIAV